MRLTVMTGSRADYGVLYPLLRAIQSDSRFELDLVATAMHLWPEWMTIREVKSDFPAVTEVAIVRCPDCPAMEVSRTVEAMTDHFIRLTDSWAIHPRKRPDWIVILGDRVEALGTAIAGAYCGIPVAHIQGGDRTETIDESARHAITRFAHLHFPCSLESANRIQIMGEEAWRVRMVGALGIYAMPDAQFVSKKELCEQWGLDATREIVLVIQHPISTQAAQAGQQMTTTLEAIKGLQTVVIYANSDPGSQAMLAVIEKCEWIKSFQSLPYVQFMSLLKASDVIVGNSSCALYEAPFFGTRAVNIGVRQNHREHGDNVLYCGHNVDDIREAVKAQIAGGRHWGTNPFDLKIDGVKIILDTLASTRIDEDLIQKRLTF